MRSRPRTLIFARDAGAANALTPIALSGPASVVASGHARAIFSREGVRHLAITDGEQERPATIVRDERPEAVLTGTSLEVARDHAWWSAAAELGIPSMGVVDHWSQFAERFSIEASFDRMPDLVAVMDERARQQMLQLGCPEDSVVVTGHPAFDRLFVAGVVGRASTRSRWAFAKGESALVFALEPLARDYGPRAAFDESDVFEIVWQATEGLPFTVVVRPHPTQRKSDVEPLTARSKVRTIVETDLGARAVIAGADAVVGMGSMFLIEAAIAGLPVLSIQPEPFDPLPRLARYFPGLIGEARDAGSVHAWLGSDATRGRRPEEARRARNAEAGLSSGATDRIWDELGRLVSGGDRPTRAAGYRG